MTDNHSANVSAFNTLLGMFASANSLFIQHPENSTKTYLFFDNVHLVKNIRNNLMNAKKFVFPSFSMTIKDEVVTSSGNGFIAWRDLQTVFDEDSMLKGNLRKAPKLTYKALHPGNNKQNVNLALAFFHDSSL